MHSHPPPLASLDKALACNILCLFRSSMPECNIIILPWKLQIFMKIHFFPLKLLHIFVQVVSSFLFIYFFLKCTIWLSYHTQLNSLCIIKLGSHPLSLSPYLCVLFASSCGSCSGGQGGFPRTGAGKEQPEQKLSQDAPGTELTGLFFAGGWE